MAAEKRDSSQRSSTVSQPDPARDAHGLLMPVTALLLGLFVLALIGLPQLHHVRADYSTPVRALVVESAQLPVATALDRVWPRHTFAYHYLYRGELYVGNVYRHRGGLREAVSRLPVGSMVTVWIDPRHPERAVIEPGPSRADLAWLALGTLLLVFGLRCFFRLVAHDLALLRAGKQPRNG
ncbi:MAG: DUF3592 domain-containing protein [Wenzhouxiangellaceae bacterium]|nr:MAG: DUF3592 domain-containing protein [Wenzhouxiangellaceae bacterium]